MPSETLEQVLESARAEIPLLRRRGATAVADAIEEYANRVERAAADYLTFVSEREAVIRTGHSLAWLRDRFPEWERQGNARHSSTNLRARVYRLLILPVVPRLSEAEAEGRTAARTKRK